MNGMGKEEFAKWLISKRKAAGYHSRREFVKAVRQRATQRQKEQPSDDSRIKGVDFSTSTLNVVENAEQYPSHDFLSIVASFFGDVYTEDLQRIVYPEDFRPDDSNKTALSPKALLIAKEIDEIPSDTLDVFLALVRQFKAVSNFDKK